MGKKRNLEAGRGPPVRTSRWWCYYCGTEAKDESALITHQLAKHFRCPHCDPKSPGGHCQGLQGLFAHVRRSHAKELAEVPGAVEGRKDPKVEIFGMSGIPDEVVDASGSDIPDSDLPAPSKPSGPTTIPPRVFDGMAAASGPAPLGGMLSGLPTAVGTPLGASANLTVLLQQVQAQAMQAQAMQPGAGLPMQPALAAPSPLVNPALLAALAGAGAARPPAPPPAVTSFGAPPAPVPGLSNLLASLIQNQTLAPQPVPSIPTMPGLAGLTSPALLAALAGGAPSALQHPAFAAFPPGVPGLPAGLAAALAAQGAASATPGIPSALALAQPQGVPTAPPQLQAPMPAGLAALLGGTMPHLAAPSALPPALAAALAQAGMLPSGTAPSFAAGFGSAAPPSLAATMAAASMPSGAMAAAPTIQAIGTDPGQMFRATAPPAPAVSFYQQPGPVPPAPAPAPVVQTAPVQFSAAAAPAQAPAIATPPPMAPAAPPPPMAAMSPAELAQAAMTPVARPAAPAASGKAKLPSSTVQPAMLLMLQLVEQVCGNWEDSEGGLIVVKSSPTCTVVIIHEVKGQETIKYTDFVVNGKFRYAACEGALQGVTIRWSNGSVWTKEGA